MSKKCKSDVSVLQNQNCQDDFTIVNKVDGTITRSVSFRLELN